MKAPNPLDLEDELSVVLDLIATASAAAGAFGASPIAATLDVASARLGAIQAALEARRTEEAAHGGA